MTPSGILETILYAEDLANARRFYEIVLGLECVAEDPGRHLFFYCGNQMLLIFDPRRTSEVKAGSAAPPHGAFGAGHLCFAAKAGELDKWRDQLRRHDVAIESEMTWSGGGRSIYFRDPAGNSLEFAEPEIWNLPRSGRLRQGEKLVVATHNPGKLKEIDELLAPSGVTAISAASLGLAEPEETEPTFGGNARLKAEHAAAASGLPALADDSGLCVDALGGEPGVHSARWAGPAKDFALATRFLEEKLRAIGALDSERRSAHFVCALCIAWPDRRHLIFEGRIDGSLVWPPRGDKGFGYDPIFVPRGYSQTFGEMEPRAKYAMSHRTRAFRKLIDAVF